MAKRTLRKFVWPTVLPQWLFPFCKSQIPRQLQVFIFFFSPSKTYQDSRLPYLPPTFFTIIYLLVTLSIDGASNELFIPSFSQPQTHVHTCHCVHIYIMVNDILIQLLGTEQCLCVTKDSGEWRKTIAITITITMVWNGTQLNCKVWNEAHFNTWRHDKLKHDKMLEKGKDGGASGGEGEGGDLGQPAWLVPDSLSPPSPVTVPCARTAWCGTFSVFTCCH